MANWYNEGAKNKFKNMTSERKIIDLSEWQKKLKEEKEYTAEEREISRLVEKANFIRQRFYALEQKYPGKVLSLETRKEYQVLHEEIEGFLEDLEPVMAILDGEAGSAKEGEFNEIEESVTQIKNKIEEKLGYNK